MKTIKTIMNTLFVFAFLFCSFSEIHGQSGNTIIKGYGDASYNGLTDNEFLKTWLILGPVKIDKKNASPDESKQKQVFDNDLLTIQKVDGKKILPAITIADSGFNWKQEKFDNGIVDFIKLYGQQDYYIAYALAEIKMDAPAKVLVGVGSDDAVKIFLNGKLVHNHWVARGFTPDEDLVILDLKKGSNQILVKVLNMQYDWSLALRKLGNDVLGEQLVQSAGRGDLDNVKLLIDNQVDADSESDNGLTAYQLAMISGRQKVVDYLKEKGAKTDIPLPAFDKLVDNIFKSAQTGITPGVAVLVARDAKIIYEKAFGYADIGNKVKVTSDTKFRIGSITKQFIATGILKFQEEGKLSVNDKLSKYMPDFPRADEVTIHHLLTHTSGIHSYTNRPGFLKYTTMPVSPSSLIDTIKAYPYDFNPGEQYLYNNSGFYILGYLLEKLSGKSLDVYLDETIFKPLGMNNTGIYQTDKVIDNEAYGYAYENDVLKKSLNWDMSWAGGAGALYSTVKDLYTWNEAIFNGKVLKEESLKAAFTPVVLNNKQPVNYGYGWSLGPFRNFQFIAHGGGLHGFLSFIERQPDTKTTVIVLCNSTPPPAGIDPGTNATTIAEYLLWDKMKAQASISSDVKVDEKLLVNYLGKYDYGHGAVMTVTLEDNQLYAQLTGQAKYPIFPASDNEFHWKIVEASITFMSDEKGNVTHAIHNQGGQQIKVTKLAE